MSVQRVSIPQQPNPIYKPEIPVSFLSTVLSRAFHNEPHLVYLIPDEETRRTVSPWFFQAAIRASQLYGEIYMTEANDAGALWMRPENDWTIRRMLGFGMMEMPVDLDWGISQRLLKLGDSVTEARKRLTPTSHWYLMVLGVGRSEQEDAIGGALIEPVLSRADAAGMPCYLETFNEKKLRFYKNHGFRITGAGKIPGAGPSFWAMTRSPKVLKR